MIRVVLVRPEQPRNIGAVIRAAANFGAESVRLVCPVDWTIASQREARVAASGAWELVELLVHEELDSAVAGCSVVAGTSARKRDHPSEPVTPAQFFAQSQGQTVAVVFGPESQGLSSAELHRCHALVSFPADPRFASLNLAQAVLLVLYEAARNREATVSEAQGHGPTATVAEQEALISALLDGGGLADARAAAQVRHWFHRAAPSSEELAALRVLLKHRMR